MHFPTIFSHFYGEFTEKIETIEMLGNKPPETDVFSEVRKKCVITEKSQVPYSVHIEEKNP